MPTALHLGLTYGAILSAFMGALIVASLRQNPLIWIGDAPADIRAKFEPVDERTKRQKTAWGVVMTLGLVVIFGLLARDTWPLGAGPTYVASLVCFQCFNLFDAVVIDLGLVTFKPRWAFVPGSEESPTYTDPRWHLGNYAKGFVGGFVFAGIVTGLAWGVSKFH